MADNNFFAQLADFQFNIDSLNTVLLGDDNTSVTIDGVTKPSISKALNDKFNNAEFGLVVFQTYAQLDAHTPLTTERKGSFKVANDSNRALNGYYAWVSGTAYIKDADLVVDTINEENDSIAVSGKAVSGHTKIPFEDLNKAKADLLALEAKIPVMLMPVMASIIDTQTLLVQTHPMIEIDAEEPTSSATLMAIAASAIDIKALLVQTHPII